MGDEDGNVASWVILLELPVELSRKEEIRVKLPLFKFIVELSLKEPPLEDGVIGDEDGNVVSWVILLELPVELSKEEV